MIVNHLKTKTYVSNGTAMLHFDQSSQQDAAEFLQYLDLIISTELLA